MKLSQYLSDKGHTLRGENRLKIFLTNTLEPIEPQANLLLPAVTAEVAAAQEIKEKPILVITGNPPYAGHSKNSGEWIASKIEDYKYVDGSHFGERKHWLHDDYVKFIRFAQDKMEKVPRGIVALITNHSWLSNPTFRGMRQSLIESFHQIHTIDLHGSTKPREAIPDNVRNENVFDIMKGVSITFFIKNERLERGVWYGDIWGSRLEKYISCAELHYQQAASMPIEPETPFYFLRPHSSRLKWEKFFALDSIFSKQNVGMLTARDKLCVGFSETELIERLRQFMALDPEAARASYNIGADTSAWKVAEAQKDLYLSKMDPELTMRVAYRPFDQRFVYYTGRAQGIIGRPARALSRAIELFPLALGIVKRVEEGQFRHAIVYSCLPDGHSVSSKETTHTFPLYWPEPNPKQETGQHAENLTKKFRNYLESRYNQHYTPEEILGYIYAVLYSPTYRRNYAEFLCIDYPRIPFPSDGRNFDELSNLGWTLVQAHLLRDLSRRNLADYDGQGNHCIKKVRYSAVEEAIHINKTQCFRPVPQGVWEFHIGGYQVLDKYLKSRRGRTLSLDEIEHVAKVADSLAFTIDQMAAIDVAYREAFEIRG